jgi:hypothetical protein
VQSIICKLDAQLSPSAGPYYVLHSYEISPRRHAGPLLCRLLARAKESLDQLTGFSTVIGAGTTWGPGGEAHGGFRRAGPSVAAQVRFDPFPKGRIQCENIVKPE